MFSSHLFLLAEIADKMPTARTLILEAVVVAAVAFLLCRQWRLSAVLFTPLGLLVILAVRAEMTGDFGMLVTKELGLRYRVVAYLASALPLLGAIAGLIANFRSRSRTRLTPQQEHQAPASRRVV